MAVRTINFLPSVFRTTTNQKFLNATIEQATSDVNLVRVNGYVGRKFTPTFKSTDNYLLENSENRANYQLEPTAIVKKDGKTDVLCSYLDLINTLGFHGVNTDDHDRLFESEFYNFDGLIDYDKFVNFSQYYWLPGGPDSVKISTTNVPVQAVFDLTRYESGGYYTVSNSGNLQNPPIYLARGGSYTFNVGHSNGFWIQSEAGISGFKQGQNNVSSREVLGVVNNGAPLGTLQFNVPQNTDQSFFVTMNSIMDIDLATDVRFADINGKSLNSVINDYDGIDGQRNLDGKFVIFLNQDQTDWTIGGTEASLSQKYGIWRITLTGSTSNPTITLNPYLDIPLSNKVRVKEGRSYGNREFYKATNGYLQIVPVITAIQDTLYYQDANNPTMVGEIRLVDPVVVYEIDINRDIIGAKEYLSPGGVQFTNGLKVMFDDNVSPAEYKNSEFYVEGVGKGIRLIRVTNLKTPESFNEVELVPFDSTAFDVGGFEESTDKPATPDYITINRGSSDLNAWTRNNRWFHIDVIQQTSKHNNFVANIDQTLRAQRPIIEFNRDLKLFNYGTISKSPIDLIDRQCTDIRSLVEGATSFIVDGVVLSDGMRVLFTNDYDSDVNNRIYKIEFINPDETGPNQIHLVPTDDSESIINDTVVVRSGITAQGKQFWFNGSNWVLSQQKTNLNQYPLFDIFDSNGNSLSDPSVYPGTNFSGTRIFSYKVGTGTPDKILGFPLSYRNMNSVGDIQFENNFDLDTFTSSILGTVKINRGFAHVTTGREIAVPATVWSKIKYPSQQFQVYSYDYTNSNRFIYEATASTDRDCKTLKVYVGNQLLADDDFSIVTVKNKKYLEISDSIDLSDKKINILVYDSSKVRNTYYQIPDNLDNNALNRSFETATLGQLRDHYKIVYENNTRTSGLFPGRNNSRDVLLSENQGKILQHSAGLPYAMLFLTDTLCNLLDSLEHARKEYITFKNKFIEICYRHPDIDSMTADQAVDHVLSIINDVKTSSWPWYYSDTIPCGKLYIEKKYTVNPGFSRTFAINTSVEMNAPSSTSVLVFHNGQQLLRGIDYEFNSTSTSLTINSAVTLTVGDQITLREYQSTDGSWVPETPTKLGLYPKFTPEIIADNTYLQPVSFIRGHDGSMTPVFGDHRDSILLELEKRIFNNIKVKYDVTRLNYHDVIPGQYRDTGYSKQEVDEIFGRDFVKWAGNNKINYTDHTFFDSNDAFTWNYKRFQSTVDGKLMPGHWRAIFEYMYDTSHPGTRPWEMLGFSQEPDWWQGYYGPAPYTSGNLVLWEDLAEGRIYQGERAGIDPRYARPSLLNYIPVNEFGQLRAPSEFLAKNFNGRYTNGKFSFGDHAPAETAWRNSSEFPFAVQRLLALTKPAKYFGLNFDVFNYVKNQSINQYLLKDSNRRPTTRDVLVNGTTVNGTIIRSSGYLNWISDYVRSLNIDPTITLLPKIQDLEVQLSYKIGGFTDKKYLKVFAEQNSPQSTSDSIIVPDDDYELVLKKSTPIKRLSYSAVIIEQTVNGYRVDGYDYDDPFFRIIPSDTNGEAVAVNIFGGVAPVYQKFIPTVEKIPYGYEFPTASQAFDFLISYGRYLESQGFKFENRSTELNETKNWIMAAKEFVVWAQQGWAESNIIMLSPVQNMINVSLADSVIDQISRTYHGSRILDQNFTLIKDKDLIVDRIGNEFSLSTANGSTISLAVLNTVQHEHVFLPNNITVFNDIIYQPELGNRQSRLRLVGFKTGSWTGAIAPPGFLLNQDNVPLWKSNKDYFKGTLVRYKDRYFSAVRKVPAMSNFDYQYWTQIDYEKIKKGLIPNFTNKSSNIEKCYSIDDINFESDIDIFSKRLLGYQVRDYFNDLGLEDSSQIKFYQGFIKQKGTRNAITALTRAKLDNLSSDISYYEEWAFRTGEYGATDINQMIEIQLDDSKTTNNLTTFKLLSVGETAPTDIPSFTPEEIYRRPKDYNGKPFITRNYLTDLNRDINRAGYPRLDDIDHTIFDLTDINNLSLDLDTVGIDDKIWVAKDFNSGWNVYRVTETNSSVISLSNATNGFMRVTLDNNFNFSTNDIVIIKEFDGRFDNIYRITQVLSTTEFLVKSTEEKLKALINPATGAPGDLEGLGQVFKLQSVRYSVPADAASTDPLNLWKIGDKIWIDQYNSQQDWAVLEKTVPWTNSGKYLSNVTGAGNLGSSAYISTDSTKIFVGAPEQSVNGRVLVYNKATSGDTLTYSTTIVSGLTGNAKFGFSIAGAALDGSQIEEFIAIGAPGANGGDGAVLTMKKIDGVFTVDQLLEPPGSEVGYSVAMSKNARWLYIGSPGNNSVYAYALDVGTKEYVLMDTITVVGSSSGDRFGHSVITSSDGSQLLVGAPFADSNSTLDNGSVYVIDRSAEAIQTDGNTSTFVTVETPNLISGRSLVTVNNVIKTYLNDYQYDISGNVVFYEAPAAGSVIRIDTNIFRHYQTINSTTNAVGNQFGESLAICSNDCSLYVGNPNYTSEYLNSGSVTRLVNQSRIYGTITGTVSNPTITAGDSIKINNFPVVFTGTTLASVVNDINAQKIPGITATAVANKLVIASDSVLELDKLRVSPMLGTAFNDLGLTSFIFAQLILNPEPRFNSYFGKLLLLSDDASTLYVGSPDAGMRNFISFDSTKTTFDLGSTSYSDIKEKSGAVYVFEYLDDPRKSAEFPGKFDFIQELAVGGSVDDLAELDQFGSCLAVRGNYLIVGAKGDDEKSSQSGAFYQFKTSGDRAWKLLRQREGQIETDAINRVFLYSISKNQILTYLDIFDPAKGKILGSVDQDISYISDADPAVYNNGTNSDPSHWTKEFVGKYWWDTSQVRFIDYEQGDYLYRMNYWGKIFPGSQVMIYEWVESPVLPSQFVSFGGSGKPKHEDDTSYVVVDQYDEIDGTVSKIYYYWVGNRPATEDPRHTYTTQQLASIIQDPRPYNIPYAAIMGKDLVSLYNTNEFISGTDTVLAVDYDLRVNQRVIHTEFQLVQEGNSETRLPERIVSKLFDSLSGKDIYGNAVPQITPAPLPVSIRYGIGIRPRQTVFVDRIAALRTLVNYVNSVLITNKIAENCSLLNLEKKDPIPSPTIGNYTDTVNTYQELTYVSFDSLTSNARILVLADEQNSNGSWAIYQRSGRTWNLSLNQSYDTTKYWNFRDWYATGFDSTMQPTYTVADRNQVAFLTLNVGDVIRINNRGNGLFEFLRVSDDFTFETVGLENGTIELLPSIYTDSGNSTEIRNILTALRFDIFIKELSIEFNNLFFLMIRRVLLEQKFVDWAFKTSFIGIKHRLRSLETFPNYQIDNQEYFEKYIQEVKPYRTKIREYLLDYFKTENFDGDVTDFDLPAYYDSELRNYRSPSGELSKDATLWNNDEKYRNWNENYKYSISHISLENAGSGYVSAPTVVITGGGGTGATAYARVAEGYISAMILTNPGEGYTSTPTVVISGGGGSGGRAYAHLINEQIRSILTTIKFDRITYGTKVKKWKSTTQFYRGDIIDYQDSIYLVSDDFISPALFSIDNLVLWSEVSISEWVAFKSYVSGDLVTYSNRSYRAMAEFTSGSSFSQVSLLVHTNSAATTTWAAGTNYVKDTIISHGSLNYIAQVNFKSGPVFSTLGFEGLLDNANDRSLAYYQPDSGMPGRDLAQLYDGIEYPGVRVDDLNFAYRDEFYDISGVGFDTFDFDFGGFGVPDVLRAEKYYDTNIQSSFTDTDLGNRPEDIKVDGSSFVNPWSSHAPEEVLPGRMYDALDIQVYSIDPGDLDLNGAGSEINFLSHTADGTTSQFLYTDKKFGDYLFVYTAQRGPQISVTNYTQDYVNKTITFLTPLSAGDRVYIYSYDSSGANTLLRTSLVGNGSQTEFELPITYQLIKDSLVFVNGARKTVGTSNDYTIEPIGTTIVAGQDSRRAKIKFKVAPANNSLVDVHLFGSLAGTNQFSQVATETKTMTGASSDYVVNLSRSIQTEGPWHSNIIVELNGLRLRPPHNSYYVGNGTDTSFVLDLTSDVTAGIVANNDIEVYKNGTKLSINIHYTIQNPNIDGGISVIFNTAPTANDRVTLSCLTKSEYRTNVNNQILISSSVAIASGNKIRVHSFSRHDDLRIRTQVFVGGNSVETTTYEGFDLLGFENDNFDDQTTISRIIPNYFLSRPVGKLSHLWVTLNGSRLLPGYDFTMLSPTVLKVGDHLNLKSTDIVTVTHFTENLRARPTGYRIRQNTRGEVEYLRISEEDTTVLTQELKITDSEIFVQDVERLSTPNPSQGKPGVIFINKERITYYTVDKTNNKLGQIRRGTGGTGALVSYPVGSRVSDAGKNQVVPTNHIMEKATDPLTIEALRIKAGTDKVWYDMTAPVNQSSLQFANTIQAQFLREKYAYYIG